ncbi:MAG: DUF6285 domain-containing protein [Hyphomonadaceae bacterium]
MTKPPLSEPTAKELAESVAGYLESVLPTLQGRAAFHGRVAVNVLNIIAREAEFGPAAAVREQQGLAALGFEGELNEARAALCAAIRDGAADVETPGLVAHLLASAKDRVLIEQPNYGSLKRA